MIFSNIERIYLSIKHRFSINIESESSSKFKNPKMHLYSYEKEKRSKMQDSVDASPERGSTRSGEFRLSAAEVPSGQKSQRTEANLHSNPSRTHSVSSASLRTEGPARRKPAGSEVTTSPLPPSSSAGKKKEVMEEGIGGGMVGVVGHSELDTQMSDLLGGPNEESQSSSLNGLSFSEPQEQALDLLEALRKQRENEKFCDVTLWVHGRCFYAHRCVLAAISPYFDSVFAAKRKSGRECLCVSSQEPEVFETFLNYVYTGSIVVEKGNVGELLRLANHFLVVKLKNFCSDFLERHIDAENVLHVKEIGEKYQLPSLAKAATVYVQNSLAEVINHEVMMELPAKQIEAFVTEKAWELPQDASVKFMSRWVCHELGAREREFKALLTNVDWNLMDPNAIVEYIDQEPLFGSSERCFYYILHSLADKGIQVQKYEQMYQALQQRFGQEIDQPLGFGDNLLQMAFNSAMEGLQVPPDNLMLPDSRDGSKWANENDPTGLGRKERTKKKENGSQSLEQRRKRILARILRNRSMRKWVLVRLDKPKRRRINEVIADSSGDEECDPLQTPAGYRCHLCPFNTKKVSRLERHLATVHAHDVTYRCTECGFTCKWNREYFLHMKSHFDGPPYKCASCEYSCQKIGSLIAHKVTHMELKPYQCSDCEYKCRTKANLSVHIKTHNNEKPYRCNICGKNFVSKSSLDAHAVGHNSDKTYSCNQCSFSTKHLNQFTSHKKTQHTNSNSHVTGKKEVYRCQDSSCKYTTSKKSQLDSHMRSHAGVRPHVCSICGRRFLEKSHLVRHERIHFNERPFKCEECDYASTRRDKLKEHKTRHHGVNASAKSPYKPRPHKSNSKGSSGFSETVVYAKKSSVPASVSGSSGQSGSEASQVTAQSTDLELFIPGMGTTEGGNGAYAQLQSGSIDLQHIANTTGMVQLRSFQPGKSEIQVAHTLASIPSSELSRTLGVKLEDLQAQGLIGTIPSTSGVSTRSIKLEDLAGAVPSSGQTQPNQAMGMSGGRSEGNTTTMVLDAAQLQQLLGSGYLHSRQ